MNKLSFAFLLLFATMAAQAQPRLPENYFWKKLPNGLEIVVIENHKVPLATIEIAVRNGAYTEGAEYSGLSHLFEHMFFKANKDYPDQERFLVRTQELGAIWNGTTGEERVNYYFTFDKDSLTAGLQFMNAALFTVQKIWQKKDRWWMVNFSGQKATPVFKFGTSARKNYGAIW
jgi:zinc protease